MKKTVVILLLAATASYAAVDKLSKIGPTSPALTGVGNGDMTSTIAAGAAGVRNCLSHVSVTSSANVTLRVLDGATTTYAVDLATTVVTTGGGGAIIDVRFADEEMCGTAATAMYVKLSTSSPASASSTQKLNYSGYTY